MDDWEVEGKRAVPVTDRPSFLVVTRGIQGPSGPAGPSGYPMEDTLIVGDPAETSHELPWQPLPGTLSLYVNGARQRSTDFTVDEANVILSTDLNLGTGDVVIFAGLTFSTNTSKLVPQERLTGDGVTTVFTLNQEPVTGTPHVWLNGLLLEEDDDYTIDGDEITFSFAPSALDKVRVTYLVA